MRKKQLLATLVMLSLMQGSVYAENEAQYNDFFDVGRNQSNDSYFKTKKVDGIYQIVKDNLAGERDTVNNNGNEVTFNIYSETATSIKEAISLRIANSAPKIL